LGKGTGGEEGVGAELRGVGVMVEAEPRGTGVVVVNGV
jgi:hypothetical protein